MTTSMDTSILQEIEWVGASPSNFSAGRKGRTPKLVVIHVAGSPSGLPGRRACGSWFNNPAAQVSTHFCVGEGISQFVSTKDTAWGNGILEAPDTQNPVIAEVAATRDVNTFTISIECAGQPNSPSVTYNQPEDYQRLVRLVRYLCDTYGIPKDRTHIIGHYQIQRYNRANCPGTGFPWERFVADVAAGASGYTIVDENTIHVGEHNVTLGFKDWWLREGTSFGEPTDELVYDGEGNAHQHFEHGEMVWVRATGAFERR